jgi:hypothetical protein
VLVSSWRNTIDHWWSQCRDRIVGPPLIHTSSWRNVFFSRMTAFWNSSLECLLANSSKYFWNDLNSFLFVRMLIDHHLHLHIPRVMYRLLLLLFVFCFFWSVLYCYCLYSCQLCNWPLAVELSLWINKELNYSSLTVLSYWV